MLTVLSGLLIPFAGTSFGAAMVFFMKNALDKKIEKLLLGFASGVMIAASVWSLLIPAIDMCDGALRFMPAVTGFLLGMFFLLLLDSVIPHLHLNSEVPEGIGTKSIMKTTMMFFAVTLHNIPEGMAVGITLAGAARGDTGITLAGAAALSAGIAIQNFPEGAIISMPFRTEGASKAKAFLWGVLSGIVEPIAGAVTFLATGVMISAMPYFLSFAAGAMIYVVIEELIPESQAGEHTNIATVGAGVGFALMMALDVAFG